MSFKDKPLKKIVADKRVTLDVLHTGIVNDFQDNKDKYEHNKEILQELLKNDNEINKINEIRKEIYNYEEINKKDEMKYYLNTSLLLNEY